MNSGELFFKVPRPESVLLLDRDWSNGVLRELATDARGPILSPHAEGDQVLVDSGSGRIGYWAPFVHGGRNLWESLPEEEVSLLHLGVVEETSRQLLGLRVARQTVPPVMQTHMEDLVERSWTKVLIGEGPLSTLCASACHDAAMYLWTAQVEGVPADSIAHGDLHPGNVLYDDGQCHVIDLENMRPAPAYCDLVYSVTWSRHKPAAWFEAIKRFEDVVGRELTGSDVAAALALMVMESCETTDSAASEIVNGIHWLMHALDHEPSPAVGC